VYAETCPVIGNALPLQRHQKCLLAAENSDADIG
jgi:hypothetical protein